MCGLTVQFSSAALSSGRAAFSLMPRHEVQDVRRHLELGAGCCAGDGKEGCCLSDRMEAMQSTGHPGTFRNAHLLHLDVLQKSEAGSDTAVIS